MLACSVISQWLAVSPNKCILWSTSVISFSLFHFIMHKSPERGRTVSSLCDWLTGRADKAVLRSTSVQLDENVPELAWSALFYHTHLAEIQPDIKCQTKVVRRQVRSLSDEAASLNFNRDQHIKLKIYLYLPKTAQKWQICRNWMIFGNT